MARAPALASDGTLWVAFTDGSLPPSGSLVAFSPQLQVLSSAALPGAPLSPPLLDASGNAYLCLTDRVVSHDPQGNLRWEFPVAVTTACALSLSGPGQLDVITSGQAFRLQ